MSRFRSIHKNSSFPALLFQHGEPIVYCRRDGVTRAVQAIISRDTAALMAELGDTVQASAIVSVTDDDQLGISRAELDTAADFVLVADQQGGEPRRRAIALVTNDKVGRIRLAIF